MEEGRRWIPYCGEAPGPEAWLAQWNPDPVLGLTLIALALALMHPALAGAADRGPQRRAALRGGWLLAVLLYVSPLCALSSAFFTARVIHHMALVFVLAPLLAWGLWPWMRRLPTPLWTCTALATAVFWAWHAPAPYAAALSSAGVFWVMQLTLLASAAGFWLAVGRAGPALALAAILVSTIAMGLLGALITFASRPLYPPHFASSLSWGVTPLQDQQLAGITMWAPGSLGYLLAALWIGWRWMGTARRPDWRVETA